MVEPHLHGLEAALTKQPFALLDATALCAPPHFHHGFVDAITGSQKLTHLPPNYLETATRWYNGIPGVLDQSVSFITRDVFTEVQDGIRLQRKILNRVVRNTSPSEQKSVLYLTAVPLIERVQEAFDTTLSALKDRQVFFKEPTIYHTLFSFFRVLIRAIKPPTKKLSESRRLQHGGTPHYGDESICAATFYFTMTGENNVEEGSCVPTAVFSADTDIQKALRAAYDLFEVQEPSRLRTMTAHSPFTLFIPAETFGRYRIFLDSRVRNTMGSYAYLKQVLGEEQTQELLTLAQQTLKDVMDYLSPAPQQ